MSLGCIPDRVLDHAKWQLHADKAIRDQFCGHHDAFVGACWAACCSGVESAGV